MEAATGKKEVQVSAAQWVADLYNHHTAGTCGFVTKARKSVPSQCLELLNYLSYIQCGRIKCIFTIINCNTSKSISQEIFDTEFQKQ